jgi:hypothetical protein
MLTPDERNPERMRLRYGLNETDNWWHFALGEHRDAIRHRVQALDTQVVRIFVFDKHAPNPVSEWPKFAAYVQAVLDAGAVPMVTFAKFPPPYTEQSNLETFVERCEDVVWGCIEQWGGETVQNWYWCIWNEPNNGMIGGGLSFPEYRRVYERTAAKIATLLKPYLGGRKARVGGPAVDGFQNFWLDWIARFVNEVDNELVGFVSWHRYGNWRAVGEPETPDEETYCELLMAQTPDYEARARAVSRFVVGRDILNVCGELNVLSDHASASTRRFNQSVFGAAYYTSALIHLIRGGADLEMWWTATDDTTAYGLMDSKGRPNPVCLAKELFASHIQYGDRLTFPALPDGIPTLDVLSTCGTNGRRSTVLVNTGRKPWTTDADRLNSQAGSIRLLTIDGTTGGRIREEPFQGTVRLDGYGVAVVTNAASEDPGADNT